MDYKKLLEDFYENNEKSKLSLTQYYETMLLIKSSQKQINRNTKYKAKLEKEINKINDAIAKSGAVATEEQKKELKIRKEIIKQMERENNLLGAQVDMHRETSKTLNFSLATIASTEKLFVKIGKNLVKNSGYFLDQMRSVRATEKSMGVLKSQTDAFRKGLYDASVYTNKIGVDTKMLSTLQAQYSDLVGRNVLLTETNLENMAFMHKGSGLALENVAEMVSLTKGMGLNINDAVKEFDNLSIRAMKMGINQTRALGKMSEILKLSNKYTFKNGLESMKKMALYSEKFKVNIDEVAGFAERVFDVEGAIEMGAQLQVLGGKWAQISDPMNLMFKARNDIEGLQQDIINASSASAQWDSVTKSFKISTLELHRMRGVAEVTGMSLEQLKKMGEATAENLHMKAQLSGFKFSDDEMELITSLATMNNDGSFNLKINDKDVNSKDLYKYAKEINQMTRDSQSFKERAEQAMLFDEKITNSINSFKSMALPLFEAFDKAFTPIFKKIDNWISNPTTITAIQNTMSRVANGIETIGKFIINNPIESMMIGGVAVASRALFEIAKWRIMGTQLGYGFNAVANVGGGLNSGGTWLQDMMGTGGNKRDIRGGGKKLFKGGGAMALGGLALGMLSESSLINQESDAKKWMDVGSSALTWGGTGAMIGSAVPVIGTALGGALGAVGGAGYELYNQMSAKNSQSGIMNDFISRPNSEPIAFNSADTLVGLKKDGGLGRALLGKGGSNIAKGNSDTTTVTFDKPLVIKGEITLRGDNGSIGEINLQDPIFQREITRIVQQQLSTNLSGGKQTNRIL